VLYAEVREGTAWRNVLEGVVYAVGRRAADAPFELLPSIRAGEDEALLKMADALEGAGIAVALLVDLVDGTATASFLRDLARFALRLPATPKTRLWVFGQEDSLAEMSDAERNARRLSRVPVPGLGWEEFLALADLHGLQGRTELHAIHEALASGRAAGVPPRVADAVLRLGSVEAALASARSNDVLLAADTARYQRLTGAAQGALGALACVAHPFREQEAIAAFPTLTIGAAVRAGVRAGLLHPLGDGRLEFHETVRRNIIAQQTPAFLATNHILLADLHEARGNRVLEAHHAELAGLDDRAREAGRAAFFNPETADRVAARVASRGWVTPAEVIDRLRANQQGPHGWWQVLQHKLDDDSAQALLAWWSEVKDGKNGPQSLWQAPRVLVAARPDLLPALLDIAAASEDERGRHYAASALGFALRDHAFDEAVVLDRFERSSAQERGTLAETLRGSGTPKLVARWLTHVIRTNVPLERSLDMDLSELHVGAIVNAVPDWEPAQIIARRDWGFGTGTAFLWSNRESVGAGAAQLLQRDDLEPRQARVAIRLLGVAGHEALVDIARRWARREGDAQAMALAAPLMVDETTWREELASLTLETAISKSARLAAFAVYVQSGERGDELLQRVVQVSPELNEMCRWIAALSFAMRPSLFSLEMLLALLAREDIDQQERRPLAMAVAQAAHFADGPHADTVACMLLPLLAIPDVAVREPVLHALTALRHPIACAPCTALALEHAGTEVGGMAAVAACASRPASLSDVRPALHANPAQAWLVSALAARFKDAEPLDAILAEARATDRPWVARRRAMMTLERMPHRPEVDVVINSVLAENAKVAAGTRAPEATSSVLDRIHRLQLQSAAIHLAGSFGQIAVLERILETCSAPWLVFRALVERSGIEPRTDVDVARWSELVAKGPCGDDAKLQASTRNALGFLRAPKAGSGAPRAVSGSPTTPPTLTAADLLALIDSETKCPPRARIADIDDAGLKELVDRLAPEEDHVVKVERTQDDASAVVLTTAGTTVRPPPTSHTGRKGDRVALRARLVARFHDRVPEMWIGGSYRGYGFIPAVITALADEGDPVRALAVIRLLSTDLTDIVQPGGHLDRLGEIADDPLVNWIGRTVGSGGVAQLAALASFVRRAKADAAIDLMSRIMRRLEGPREDSGVLRQVGDLWQRTLSSLLQAERLRDVPGAGRWLVHTLLNSPRGDITREWIVEAMREFPSTWYIVESEALRALDYRDRRSPHFRRAERVADALFWAKSSLGSSS
jgi:hypothetical protein